MCVSPAGVAVKTQTHTAHINRGRGITGQMSGVESKRSGLDQVSEVQRRQRLSPVRDITELGTVGGICTDEGEDVIHQLTEMRVTETQTIAAVLNCNNISLFY